MADQYNQIAKAYLKLGVDPRYIEKRIDPSSEKGKFSVYAVANIKKGEFICEYSGELVLESIARYRLEKVYKRSEGSFILYFKWNSRRFCIDATKPSSRLGRLINHSRSRPNCALKIFLYDGKPRVILVATKSIKPDSEILFDYGERDRSIIESNPWLAQDDSFDLDTDSEDESPEELIHPWFKLKVPRRYSKLEDPTDGDSFANFPLLSPEKVSVLNVLDHETRNGLKFLIRLHQSTEYFWINFLVVLKLVLGKLKVHNYLLSLKTRRVRVLQRRYPELYEALYALEIKTS